MESTTIKVLEDGTPLLPENLKKTLKQTSEIAISWNEELIVIHRQQPAKNREQIPKNTKNQHLIETREKLARLKQILPILEQQIQEQITNSK